MVSPHPLSSARAAIYQMVVVSPALLMPRSHSWVDGVMGVGLFEDSWEQKTGTLSSNLLSGVSTKASISLVRKDWPSFCPLHLLSCSFFLPGMQM